MKALIIEGETGRITMQRKRGEAARGRERIGGVQKIGAVSLQRKRRGRWGLMSRGWSNGEFIP